MGFADERIIQEDDDEDNEANRNLLRGQNRFKLFQDKNEFNKKNKRNRSTDFAKESDELNTFNLQCNQHFGDVSEDSEELISDSSVEKKQNDINKH